jgi:exonuclease VII large subunit
MTRRKTVNGLLAAASELADHRDQRAAWVRKTAKACRKAMHAMDDRLTAMVDRVSSEEFERLYDEEQAKVDAIRLPLKDAAERDVWPRELYFGGI